MRTPVRIGILAMISNMVFNVILIWPLAHAGIALSTTLAAFLNSAFLLFFLCKKKIYTPNVGWSFFGVRIMIANAVLGIWLWILAGDLQTWIASPWTWRTLHLFLLLISGAAIYLIALWMTGLRPHDLLIRETRPLIQSSSGTTD
jgi:putative peptidoglycan lipid II flippase